jgi:hypothetical protein
MPFHPNNCASLSASSIDEQFTVMNGHAARPEAW